MRKSSYDSMAFILDLTGCGSRTEQQIHHYALLCSWLYQSFLTMIFHCHPGDVVTLLGGVLTLRPFGPQDGFCGATRQANKQASNEQTYVERPLIKRPMRGPANSITRGSEFLWGV